MEKTKGQNTDIWKLPESSGADIWKLYAPPATPQPVAPKKTLGGKVINVAKDIVRAIVSPVATTVARPIQLGAVLAGVSDERVNEVSQKISRGLIAPTPQNRGDVIKDLGRSIQTAALVLPTGAFGSKIGARAFNFINPKITTSAIKAAKIGGNSVALGAEGALFGFGAGLEHGEGIGTSTALGAGIGAAIPLVGGALGKVFGKGVSKTSPAVEDVAINVSRDVPTTVPKPPVRRGTKPNKFNSEPVVYDPYVADSELPSIDFGKAPRSSLPTIQIGDAVPKKTSGDFNYEKIKEDIIPSETAPVTKKQAKDVPVSPKEQIIPKETIQKIEQNILKEDPTYNTQTLKSQLSAVDRDIQDVSKGREYIKNVALGRIKAPVDYPSTIALKTAREFKDLTDDEFYRLHTSDYVRSKGGSELQASKYTTDMDEYIQKQTSIRKEALKNKGITKKTTDRFFDDIECK